MSVPFNAVKLTDRVYWVGAIDWPIRDFHGHLTSRGTTYNAYLVVADKITLIDTVKAPFRDEMMSRIRSVIEPEKIDYIISHHAEMDHTGSLSHAVYEVKPEKVFASKMGVKALNKHFHGSVQATEVENGGTLDLGGAQFVFHETRMLHWPDSMVSYLVGDGILFSQDGFGMHIASSDRFADQIPDEVIRWEGAKYFANILLLYSPQVLKTLDKIDSLKLDLKMIAPDHGPIWRKDFGTMPALYREWAEQKPNMKAVVVYDSMWNSTSKMARAIGEGLTNAGAQVAMMSLSTSHRSDVATELLEAGALIVGSPTLNNGLFPTLADCMTYVKGLKPKNLVGQAFGSYGWSGESVKNLLTYLDEMKVELVGDPVKVQYVPEMAELDNCRELGKLVAAAMKEKLA